MHRNCFRGVLSCHTILAIAALSFVAHTYRSTLFLTISLGHTKPKRRLTRTRHFTQFSPLKHGRFARENPKHTHCLVLKSLKEPRRTRQHSSFEAIQVKLRHGHDQLQAGATDPPLLYKNVSCVSCAAHTPQSSMLLLRSIGFLLQNKPREKQKALKCLPASPLCTYTLHEKQDPCMYKRVVFASQLVFHP